MKQAPEQHGRHHAAQEVKVRLGGTARRGGWFVGGGSSRTWDDRTDFSRTCRRTGAFVARAAVGCGRRAGGFFGGPATPASP